MFLYQNILYIHKFLIRYKEFYIKTTNKFRINQISIKGDAKNIKVILYQKLLLFHFIISFWSILWP